MTPGPDRGADPRKDPRRHRRKPISEGRRQRAPSSSSTTSPPRRAGPSPAPSSRSCTPPAYRRRISGSSSRSAPTASCTARNSCASSARRSSGTTRCTTTTCSLTHVFVNSDQQRARRDQCRRHVRRLQRSPSARPWPTATTASAAAQNCILPGVSSLRTSCATTASRRRRSSTPGNPTRSCAATPSSPRMMGALDFKVDAILNGHAQITTCSPVILRPRPAGGRLCRRALRAKFVPIATSSSPATTSSPPGPTAPYTPGHRLAQGLRSFVLAANSRSARVCTSPVRQVGPLRPRQP